MKNYLIDQDCQKAISKKFISASTAYFIKKSHLSGINKSNKRDSEESFGSMDLKISGGNREVTKNKDISDIQKKNPKLRATSLPRIVHNPHLKFVRNIKNKNEQNELALPSVTHNDNIEDEDDSILDLDGEYLKTEGAKVVSFGLIISKVTGEDNKILAKQLVPAIDFQKVNRSGQVLRGRPVAGTIMSNRDSFSLCKPVNGNPQLTKTKRVTLNTRSNKKMSIDGFSLWSERSTEENAMNNADSKLKSLVENMSFNQLKNMIFEKKHVNTVDIINKHIPLFTKPRK